MKSSVLNKTANVLRWIVFIPLASLSAWLAWIIFNFLGKFSFFYAGADIDSFLGQLYLNTIGHIAMGAAFVYAGAKIVPSHKLIVVYVLAGLGLVFSGILLYPAVMVADWWAVWGGVSLIAGIGIIVYSIYAGEIDIK